MFQKFNFLTPLHRIFVVDDSSASGHLIELQHLRQMDLPRIVLLPDGRHSSFMALRIPTDWEIVVPYSSPAQLPALLDEALSTMDDRIAQRTETLSTVYPWRYPSNP